MKGFLISAALLMFGFGAAALLPRPVFADTPCVNCCACPCGQLCYRPKNCTNNPTECNTETHCPGYVETCEPSGGDWCWNVNFACIENQYPPDTCYITACATFIWGCSNGETGRYCGDVYTPCVGLCGPENTPLPGTTNTPHPTNTPGPTIPPITPPAVPHCNPNLLYSYISNIHPNYGDPFQAYCQLDAGYDCVSAGVYQNSNTAAPLSNCSWDSGYGGPEIRYNCTAPNTYYDDLNVRCRFFDTTNCDFYGNGVTDWTIYDVCGPYNFDLPTPTVPPTPTLVPAAARARARTFDTTNSLACSLWDSNPPTWTDSLYTISRSDVGYSAATGSLGANYVEWNPLDPTNPLPGTYYFDPVVPANYTQRNCLYENWPPIPTIYRGNDVSAWNFDYGTKETWEVGYFPPGGWIQTVGGDVYASTQITSLIPLKVPALRFSLNYNNDPSLSPGVVTYGSDPYDFALDGTQGDSTPPNYVSTEGWLVKSQNIFDNIPSYWYDLFYGAVGKPGGSNIDSQITRDGLLACYTSEGLCYINDNASIDSQLTIQNTDHFVVFISGSHSLAINAPIRVINGGFIMFVVSGGISVDSGVGVDNPGDTDESKFVEGLYVTAGNMTINSTGATDKQFVGKGSFIANTFTFNRNLGTDNVDHPTHLFIHNPRLLIEMPDIVKQVIYNWQEVAPR